MKSNLKRIWDLLAGPYQRSKQRAWIKSVRNLPSILIATSVGLIEIQNLFNF